MPPALPRLLWRLPIPVALFLGLSGLVAVVLLSVKPFRPGLYWDAPFAWSHVLAIPSPAGVDTHLSKRMRRWQELAAQQPIHRRSIHLHGTPRKVDVELTLSMPSGHPLVRELAEGPDAADLGLLARGLFGVIRVEDRDVLEGRSPIATWSMPPQEAVFTFVLRIAYPVGHPPLWGDVQLADTQRAAFVNDELTLSFEQLQLAGLSSVPLEANATSARFQTSALKEARELRFSLHTPPEASSPGAPPPPGSESRPLPLRTALLDSTRLLSHDVVGPLARLGFILLVLPMVLGLLLSQLPPQLLASVSLRSVFRKLLVFQFSLPVLLALLRLPGRVDWLANFPVDFALHRDWSLSWLLGDSLILASIIFLFVLMPALLLQGLPEDVPPAAVLPTFRRAGARFWKYLGMACMAALLGMSGFALAFSIWEYAEKGWVSLQGGMALLGSLAALLAVALVSVLYRLLAARAAPRGLPWVTVMLLVAGALITSRDASSSAPGVLKNAVWLGLGPVLGLALLLGLALSPVPLLRELFAPPRPEPAPGAPASPLVGWLSRLPGWQWLGAALFMLLVAVPVPINVLLDAPLQNLWVQTWLFTFPFELDRLLLLGGFTSAMLFLRQRGDASPRVDELSRRVALVALALMLFTVDAWEGLPVKVLLGLGSLWLLVRPARHWTVLEPLFQRVVSRRWELLNALLMVGAVERGAREVRKSMHAKLAAGELAVEDYVDRLEKTSAKEETLVAGTLVEGRPVRDVAFAFGPHVTAWRNGMHGASWASLFAAPWSALFLLSRFNADVQGYPYPLLNFCIDTLTMLLKWASYGFCFGYFFPYIRGRSGLGKSFHFFLAIVLPSLPGMLLENTTREAWRDGGFWVLQLFTLCMLLGLFAFDYQILRKTRHHWRMLFEIHGLPSVGISLSSLLVAMGTTITTLVNNETQSIVKLLLGFFLPSVSPGVMPPGP